MSDVGQGDLAVQSFFEGKHEVEDIKMEATSLSFVFDCEKNATYKSHDDFIPYKDFRLENLPERYRDHHLIDVINVIAFLTVRIDVTYTSPARPVSAYPCSESRGCLTKRSGTGRIGMVWKYTDKDNRACPCSQCKKSENPVRNWGLIRVITVVHVVFDKAEALRATCRFGYDTCKSPKVVLEGVDMERADVTDDRCHLSCVTHDLKLLERMKLQWSRYPALHKKVTEKFKDPDDRLVVIVSHPHGCCKQVSLGTWAHKETTGESSPGHPFVKYAYTATTCPGSSGATVYVMGRTWGLWYNQIHSGHSEKHNYNYSGNGCH